MIRKIEKYHKKKILMYYFLLFIKLFYDSKVKECNFIF